MQTAQFGMQKKYLTYMTAIRIEIERFEAKQNQECGSNNRVHLNTKMFRVFRRNVIYSFSQTNDNKEAKSLCHVLKMDRDESKIELWARADLSVPPCTWFCQEVLGSNRIYLNDLKRSTS